MPEYTPDELGSMFTGLGITQFNVKVFFPYCFQSVMAHK